MRKSKKSKRVGAGQREFDFGTVSFGTAPEKAHIAEGPWSPKCYADRPPPWLRALVVKKKL
jgi:hypothetical protein